MIRVRPRRALVALVYMAGISFLSSLPASTLVRFGLSGFLLNLGHIPLYAGLGAVTFWSLQGARLPRAVATVVICGAFALFDEWFQQFMPGRTPALDDLVADGAGILIGIVAVGVLPQGWRLAFAPRNRKGDIPE